ncbi:MAG: hypothetical protein WCQ49_02820 [Candidatus Saccharibacteria bacterium]
MILCQNNKIKFISMFVIAALSMGVLSFVTTTSAFAATRSWVGTACAATGDCSWSETTNWQGGVVPVNGDNVFIDNLGAPDEYGTFMDIANLTIANLTVTGVRNAPDSNITIGGAQGSSFTITGNITYAAPALSSIPNGYYAARLLDISTHDITLAGDSVFTNVTGDTSIALGGHKLTVIAENAAVDDTYGFEFLITGNGTVEYRIPADAALFLNGLNSYSGVTNLVSMNYATTTDQDYTGTFGTSVINIGAAARILYKGDGNITINNKINITPPSVTGTFLDNQIEFWDDTTSVVYTVPNITLLGNARIGTLSSSQGGTVTVNLNGIIANGYCIQYGSVNDDGIFQNGPAACVVEVAAPAVPNTAFNLSLANPVIILGSVIMAVGSIFGIMKIRKQQ